VAAFWIPCFISFPHRGLWDPAIVHDFPKLFENFKKKIFNLLWRGSRDGFRAQSFHSPCHGYKSTLTVILDTHGNIFGGFTPVKWVSNSFDMTAPSLNSFLFTLKNPHNVPPRRFALKAKANDQSIWRNSNCGPHFYDIGVHDSCHENTDSATFMISNWFQVNEIEVFEIMD
jgi:hypothetical protein